MRKSTDLLPGTLDMLILKAVSLKPLHGYGVLLRIRQISGEALEIPQGSLYPALYRLEHQDLIVAEWAQSENNRRAKYYTLTAAGRRVVREERLHDVVQGRAGHAEAVAQTQPEQDVLGLRRNDSTDPLVVPERHRLAQHRAGKPVRRRASAG